MKQKAVNAKHQLLSKFIKVFLITFTILFVIAGLMTGIYLLVTKDDKGNPIGIGSPGDNPSATDPDDPDGEEDTKLKKVTTFAIFGTDREGYRTDVTMLVFFNSESNKIDVVSVPRDTMITLPDDLYAEITAKRSADQTMKINEVPAYVDSSDRNDASVRVLESTLGIEVDYYVNLELADFIDIVDLIGPITVEIPFDMIYSDPVQDLYINLEEGTQEINGAQAEQLIRYRKGYNNGDIGRIDMQHEFMKAFFAKLMNVENKMNIINIAQATLTYVDTDFVNAIDYVNYIDDISMDNLTLYTLPGEGKMMERSYYVLDVEGTTELLQSIYEGEAIEEEIAPEKVNEADLVDIKTLKISVQNGTYISKFAGKTATMLQDDGYTVAETIDYEGEKPLSTTKIIVPSEKVGQTISAYFKNPTVEVDETIFEEDIQLIIILGESDGETE